MKSAKNVSFSQQTFDFDVENTEYLDERDEQFITLLEEVLTEVFLSNEEEESFVRMEGRSIYFLGDEKEISAIEKADQEALDEGSPDIDDMDKLKEIAESYFVNPKCYPIKEEEEESKHITGFIQVYGGERFDSYGKMTSFWKSSGEKVVINLSDLYEIQKIISAVESRGFKWSPILRITFYGNPLSSIIGSRFYLEKEARELVVWDNAYPNILLAVPDYSETDAYHPSIFEVVDSELQESIITGKTPNYQRVTLGHHEMTKARLEELAEQELEEMNLLQFSRREKKYVEKKNSFRNQYKEALFTITGLNNGSLKSEVIFQKSLSILEDILYLSERCSVRLNNPIHYHQVKALFTKLKLQDHLGCKSIAFKTIEQINQGLPVEIHLISNELLQEIFDILWGNLGIRINEEKKDIYLALKDRLLRVRSKKLRSPA